MTSLTLATIAIVVYGVLNKRGYGRALALAGVTASGSAAVVGSIAVPTFYAVALGAAVALGLQLLGSGAVPSNPRRPLPGPVWLLVLFLLWSILVTLLAPALFNGMTVYVPAGATKLAIGYFTTSNVAQIIYLALGVCVVCFLARHSKPAPELVGLVTGTATLLSLWRYLNQLIGLPFPEGLFDNSPAFAYIESAPDDVERFRGIFSEPSGLAGLSLVTIAYMLPRSLQLRGGRRAGALLTAGTAAYLGAISTSATFVVAGVAVGLIAGVTFALRFLLRRTSVSVLASVAGCALVIGALWFLPILAGFVGTTVNQKVGSASFSERSAANDAALDVLIDTFGFGVGLGSNRASSFVPGLLSTTGIVGTIVFAAAVAILIQRASAVREYRPVIWALVTLLVAKVVAGPDIHDTSGVMWISLGLLSAAASNVGAPGGRGMSPLVTDLSAPATWSGGKPWADLESE